MGVCGFRTVCRLRRTGLTLAFLSACSAALPLKADVITD